MATIKLDAHLAPYLTMLQGWRKAWGTKPTADALKRAHHLVSTKGGKHAIGAACAERAEGVHDWQLYEMTQLYKYVGGRPQTLHTYRNDAAHAGLYELTTTKAPVSVEKPFGVKNTHWQMKITPKGEAEYKRHLAAGTVDGLFQRKAAATLAELEVANQAKQAAAKAKAKASREAKKAAKATEPQVAKPLTDNVSIGAYPINLDAVSTE